MTRLCCRIVARLAPFMRRGPVALALLTINVGHAAIHGTPLDGGALDSIITNLDAWLLSQAQL